MAENNDRRLIDRLGTVSTSSLQRLRDITDAADAGNLNIGLTRSRGARVLDLLTGLAGVVQDGRRDDQAGAIVFRVQLADLRVVYRTVDELVDDQAPAVKPEGAK